MRAEIARKKKRVTVAQNVFKADTQFAKELGAFKSHSLVSRRVLNEIELNQMSE